MREIKFRGKRVDYNWFVYGHYYYSLDDDAHIITDIIHHKDFVCNNMSEPAHDEQINYHVRPDTVGQFTGLHDMNGKEIYDGDIVIIHNYTAYFKNGKPNFDYRIFEVKYNKYTWAFNNDAVYMPLSNYDSNTLEDYKIEIIGNIYEGEENEKD